ncbi:MAG: fibro-slime domain-containing protein [Myxococcales bacterium]|nr:fibro-slime domain-containing protein [Myxococcales bacterium]
MRSRAPLLALASTLACNGGDGREESGAATNVTTATTPGTATMPTTGASSPTSSASESTAAVTADTGDADTTTSPATSVEPDTGPVTGDDTTSTSSTTLSTVTADPTVDITGFETGGFDCDMALKATVRDFRVDHPDFEDYTGDTAYKGLVEATLGPDDKPVHAAPGGTPQTTGPAQFAQWYNDTPNVNIAFAVDLTLTEVMPGVFSYQNGAFYPIDDQGWGNEGNPHNYHFTTEIHTSFVYKGGEKFTFTGDDDLWLFINGKLAIDLGGTHPELTDTVDLDAQAATLGLAAGNTYAMDIFHAERHTDQSNFRIDTSIDCFIIPG